MIKWLKHQRREHRLAFWPSGIVGVLVVVGGIASAAAPPEPTANANSEQAAKADAKPEPTAKADPKPESEPVKDTESKPTPQKRVRDALAEVGGEKTLAIEDPEVKDITFDPLGKHMAVVAKTPEGGFDGASCEDLDRQAGAIFAELYDEAGWRGDAVVSFQGGLVDKATGRDLPEAKTGFARMRAGQAKQIDWANDDALANIDWSTYREFCHPAVKQD
jgi:hypothetical protein